MSAVNNLLTNAKSWTGYLEKSSNASLDDFTANAGSANYTRFARDYCNYFGESINVYQAQPWCAMFVSCVFAYVFGVDKAEKMIYGHYAYCPYGVQHFKNNGAWHTSPQAGDVIFFAKNGVSTHTGIVIKVSDGKVYTVEGNTSPASGVVANGGCVAQKSYTLGYSKILGYGRPKWSVAEAQQETKNVYDTYLKEFMQRGIISDKTIWGDYNAPTTKAQAVALIDKATGGMWASEEDNMLIHWAQPHVISLCGKGVITDKEQWTPSLDSSISKALLLALADKITNGMAVQYQGRATDHWGRNHLDSLCDKGIVQTPEAWTDFEGEVSRGNTLALLYKALGY